MCPPIKRHARGFTLIEVLLALMIFATLSMSANQIFSNVITSDKQTEEVGNALKTLQRTLLIMDSDFRQMMARQYRNGGDEAQEALLEFSDDLLDSESQGIRFVRGGWINPQALFPRGEVVKVGYRIQDNTLERIRWMYPDDSSSVEPAIMPVMEGVKDISFAVLGSESWQESWDSPLEMPKAIRVTLDTDRYGELVRIYVLSGQTLPAPVAGGTP
ncbi:type II secretion system protein GspJ [Enterovibrio norvegicus FF-33]|uniref:Type II secretion system protein J n=1 Tax=Enterovibrio norvegicus FF-454 TaxID=1185651 RepID=A0A1E5CEA9_9GAMM|nr:type II secretion system minor pseudopilin GspJ [Enterovibrio norvegicus]OEE63492.1 type II secretion system protein GspJ [Enterovibrio norvegicus FF-454]OEE71148.1 type II secretion system protein GspJ [Enterovibrio norvegicus FF-33]OEE74661.1 type II secretion system protein GspJ [Enterovibrio norvegicus FF-162]